MSEPSPRRGRPRKVRAANGDTRETIMDAAEDLFSKHGFHGVTMREVARKAEVDQALLHYYFGTKAGLFDAMFLRRAEVINRIRLDALDAYERRAGDAMTVEGCMEAFLGPLFAWAMTGGPGWRNYFALLAQVNATPEWGGATMTRYFDPVVERLLDMLRRALPEAADVDLFWCYNFLSGAMTLSLSETGRIDRLSNGLCRSEDMEALFHRFVPFAAAGFRQACAKPTECSLSKWAAGQPPHAV